MVRFVDELHEAVVVVVVLFFDHVIGFSQLDPPRMDEADSISSDSIFGDKELHIKEDALVNFKSELAVLELEVQALVTLAEEIAKSAIPEGSRKINGKYIKKEIKP
ncbi:protein PTST, chloroplastic isoform X2 [Fagus crenata]